MTAVVVIGAEGFLGSAFAAQLGAVPGVQLLQVTRANYAVSSGRRADIVIDCAGNSRKYVAEEHPAEDLELSVAHRLRTLLDFQAGLHVHVSSVDVYSSLDDPAGNHEGAAIDVSRTSHYGFHKLLAEQLVRHYAADWLILRLGGMVGPRLRKNPVYDILEGRPLRIHPDSRSQFLATSDVARIAWDLVCRGLRRDIVNVCGSGLISPRDVAALAGREMDVSLLDGGACPRIVDVNVEKLCAIMPVPETVAVIRRFLATQP